MTGTALAPPPRMQTADCLECANVPGVHRDTFGGLVCDARPARFGARQIVFREGDPVAAVYHVRAGLVRTCQALAAGGGQGLRLVGRGGFVGLDALGSRSHPTTAQALTPSVLCAISPESLDRLVASGGRASGMIASALAGELRDLRRRLREVGLRRSLEKVAAFLAACAADDGAMPPGLSQRDIAEFLGLRHETVCRALARLRLSGLVEVGDRLRVVDPAAIRRIGRGASGADA